MPAVGVAANTLSPASCPTAYPVGYNPATHMLASDATMFTFNALAQETSMYTPAPAGQTGHETTSYAYDADGNLVQATEPSATSGGPAQVTVDTYNANGEIATQTTGSGSLTSSTTSYCYDPNGYETSVVYADGSASGVAQCETSSPWVVSSSSYPTQAGYQTTYSLDSINEDVATARPATSVAPHGATYSYTYDQAGNVLTSTDPNGVTTTYTLTPLGYESGASYSGSSAPSATFSYDAEGNLTSMSDGTGNSSYQYDSFGELISAENGASQTTGYGYNADGEVNSITYPLPATAVWATSDQVIYGYNNADMLTGATDFNANNITIGETADGQINSEGLGSSGDTISTTYSNTGEISSVALKNATSTLLSFSYSDSPGGTILNEADTPSSSQSPATYSYDAQGRVTSMTPGTGTTQNYGLDQAGNLTALPGNATGHYDDAGELTSSVQGGTTTAYTYDADGNRLSATRATGSWNGAGQLTSYADSTADMTSAAYDGTGLRASTATTVGGTPTQDFVWDLTSDVPNLLMDSAHAYIYVSDATPAEQVSLSSGSVTYLVTDSIGSVRGTVSAAAR